MPQVVAFVHIMMQNHLVVLFTYLVKRYLLIGPLSMLFYIENLILFPELGMG